MDVFWLDLEFMDMTMKFEGKNVFKSCRGQLCTVTLSDEDVERRNLLKNLKMCNRLCRTVFYKQMP